MRTVENFLAHYGVKGMRWGVRRDRNVVAVAVKGQPSSRKLKTTGGKNFPAHDDAIRTAMLRQQGKKSKPQSLSNKELQEAITRMNLEAQFKNLNNNYIGSGQKLVRGLVGSVGDREVNQLADFASTKAGRDSAGAAVRIGAGAAKTFVPSPKKKN